MKQNADQWIINIYTSFKPGRIGFWSWPFSVIYALWLLIVTLAQPERQTVNTFEVNLLMETWKRAGEGHSLSGAASFCTLLKCLSYLKWIKTSEWEVVHCAIVLFSPFPLEGLSVFSGWGDHYGKSRNVRNEALHKHCETKAFDITKLDLSSNNL